MSTLHVDNTIDDPRQRSPLVLGHHDFASVTEEICAVNEAPKPPKLWYISLVISASLASMLLVLTQRLVTHGVHTASDTEWQCFRYMYSR